MADIPAAASAASAAPAPVAAAEKRSEFDPPLLESRDSIADIYGERTPYHGEGAWPVRVDSTVRADAEVSHWVTSACLLCSNGCGCEIGVSSAGKMVGIRGRADDRVNRGRLGPKGMHCFQVNHNEERLTTPLVRGKDGKLHPASWDEAMNLIVQRTQQLRAQSTTHAIAFYTSGQLFLEEYYVLAMIGKAGLHTLHMDGNTRLCTATAAAAMRESFGSDGQPGSYEDIDVTQCIFLVGHNMANTQTVLWSRILDRLAGPSPPSVILLDPRETTTATAATVHLANRSGTNVAVLNGLAHLIVAGGHVQQEWVDKHTVGYARLKTTTAKYTPEYVEELSGVPADKLREAARLLVTSPSVLSTVLQGVYQSHQATAAACAVNNLHLLMAQIGKPGSGILQMNGQPTAQNNREAGCNGEFPAFRNYQNPDHMQSLADVWKVEPYHIAHWQVPTHIMQMMAHIEQGNMNMLWVSGTNPAVTLPGLGHVRSLLSKPDLFLVVQDCFLTETAELASVVLPAAIWGEKRGCFTNVDRTVHFSEKAVEPPGQARSDFDIFVDYANRMGFMNKHGEPLVPFKTPEEAFKGWQDCARGRVCDYAGLSYERLKAQSGIQWPCNDKHPNGCARLYTDFHFLTDLLDAESWGHDLDTGTPLTREEYANLDPRGRAIFKVADYHPPSEGPSKEHPFALITGRSVYHFHTRTKTARVGALQCAAPDAWVELHPDDAANLGIHEGDLVRVKNEHGKVEVAARIARIAKGQVFVPMHYGAWDRHERVSEGCIRSGRGMTGGSMRSTAANELTTKLWDPVSKQPLLKSAAVKLTRLASAAEAAEQIQVELHRKTSPTQKKKSGLMGCLTHCAPDSASSSSSSSSSAPPMDNHPHGEAVSKQSKKLSESGGVEASVPDTHLKQQYLPFELHRAVVHARLLEKTLMRLQKMYEEKHKLEISAELLVLHMLAEKVRVELGGQQARFPLSHKPSADAPAPSAPSGGLRPTVGGGEGGATLAGDVAASAADTDDLHALHDALFLSEVKAEKLGSPAYKLLRDLQGLQCFATGLQGHLQLLSIAAAALQDMQLHEAIERCSTECKRLMDWPSGKAKAKAAQTLIVPV